MITTTHRGVRRLFIPLFTAVAIVLSLQLPANAASQTYCRSAVKTTVCVTYNWSTRVAQARLTNNTGGPIFQAFLQLGPENATRWAYNQRYLEKGHTMYATRYNVSPPAGNLCAAMKFSPTDGYWYNAVCHDFTP
jgi:hypothetical protein